MRVLKAEQLVLAMVLVFGLGAGCMRMESSLSKAEIAEIEKRANALYTPSPAAECRRMPLRDGLVAMPLAAVSSASEELYDLVREGGPHQSCYSLLREHREALQSDLFRDAAEFDRSFAPAAWPEAAPESITAVHAACQGLGEAVRRVVAQGSVCSPASIGGPVSWDSFGFVQWMRLGDVLLVDARTLVREGKVLEAAQLLLDGIRLSEDLSRGRVALLTAMISTALSERLVGHLSYIALTPGVLGVAEKTVVYGELLRLVDAQPHASNQARGEEAIMMKSILRSWRQMQKSSERDEQIATVLGLEILAGMHEELCPAGASYLHCAEAWSGFKQRALTFEEPLALPKKTSAAMRKEIDEVLSLTRWDGLLRRLSSSAGRLEALELAMRSQQNGQPCPAELRHSTRLGAPLAIGKTEQQVTVHMPEQLRAKGGSGLLLRFACSEGR